MFMKASSTRRDHKCSWSVSDDLILSGDPGTQIASLLRHSKRGGFWLAFEALPPVPGELESCAGQTCEDMRKTEDYGYYYG